VPELPEVEALARFLGQACTGQVIDRIEVAALSALKTYDPPVDVLRGRPVDEVGRSGKYLRLRAGDLWLVMHLARGGWVQWRDVAPPARARPGKGPLALRVGLSGGGGFDVTEQGTEKRLALWVVRQPTEVEGLARLGPDPLDPAFGVSELAALLEGRSGNIKTVLTDQSVIAGVGNSYSDEALHAARLSQF
jgi:formamidopyrimidine-DNA glycosylase